MLEEECKADEFKCASEKKCISVEKKCNGKVNCKDHSDEDVSMCSSPPVCLERLEFVCNISSGGGSAGRKKSRKDEKLKNISEKEERVEGGEVDSMKVHDLESFDDVVKCMNMEAYCRNNSIQCGDGQDEQRRSMCSE